MALWHWLRADLPTRLRDWTIASGIIPLLEGLPISDTEIELIEMRETSADSWERWGVDLALVRTQPRLDVPICSTAIDLSTTLTPLTSSRRRRTFACAFPKPAVRRPTGSVYAVAVHREHFVLHAEPSGVYLSLNFWDRS